MTGALVVLPGLLIGLGLFWVVLAFRPQHVRLGDALDSLAATEPPPPLADAAGLDRLGAWWLARRGVLVSPTLATRLELRGRTLARHYALKLAGAAAGFGLPLVSGLVVWAVSGDVPAIGVPVGVIGAAVGFILPDVSLRHAAADVGADATEALLTYFDLVTLERMANQSATQSLHAAAAVSDTTVFATIRAALDRARLQQRMPYDELKAEARRLDLPALSDLADVMRLDESGASLAGTLRARVRELRDAHLTDLKIAASDVSERMTVFMVIPSLVFGLVFLLPPILRLIAA